MKLKNDYIFLSKNEDLLGGSALNNLCGLGVGKSIIDIFSSSFTLKEHLTLDELENQGIKSFEELDSLLSKYTFSTIIENQEIIFDFFINKVLSMSYCSIEINGNSKPDICKKLELIHTEIITNKELNEEHIIICSYDSVSEYYCNKVYSKLNKFERMLRKLMLNIYTVNLKDEYYEKTIPEQISGDIKKRVGQPKEYSKNLTRKEAQKELRIQDSFNNITYEEIKEILFNKTWNSYDEEVIEKFLKNNRDLSKLDDMTLRDKFKGIKPKSDWERFFLEKGLENDFEELLECIRKNRNKVAHSKTFSSIDYCNLNNDLNKGISLVNKALKITETKDFREKNKEYLDEIGNNIKEAILIFSKAISECIKNVKNEFIEYLKK